MGQRSETARGRPADWADPVPGQHPPTASQPAILPVGRGAASGRRRLLKQAGVPVLAFLVSAAMLVWLVTNPIFGAVVDLLHPRHLGPLLLALGLFPMLQWLRAWRFSLLLRRSAELPSWPDFKLAAQLSFLNLVLPFKLGDLSFPLLAQRTVGADLLGGTVVIVWCRLTDLCVVVAVLLLCAAYLLAPGGHPWFWLASSAGGLICLVLPLALAPAMALLRAAPAVRRRLGALPDHAAALHRCRRLHLALTVAIWVTHCLIGYLAATAIASHLTLIAASFAGAASSLAFALPVTGVAGLGPPQAAWAAALRLTGVTWEISIASGLLVYGCLLLGVILTAAPSLLGTFDRARPGRAIAIARHPSSSKGAPIRAGRSARAPGSVPPAEAA